jgi:hypothetical protein
MIPILQSSTILHWLDLSFLQDDFDNVAILWRRVTCNLLCVVVKRKYAIQITIQKSMRLKIYLAIESAAFKLLFVPKQYNLKYVVMGGGGEG